ncbi:MAG: universal stress protein [Proteobacteria bacterium]|nr:universal stress protein [Pseudomonadota bacterium]MDA1308661.1 universal stress protein [Pseudomonadota bacterium]
MSETSSPGSDSQFDPTHHRVFLVVVDDSDEMRIALRFAALRAKNSGGRVALFRDIEPADFHHWAGVGELMEDEAREAAEKRLNELASEVVEISDQIPALYVRSGPIVRELMALIDEEPTISILVLAASTGKEGPGPLVSYLAGKGANTIRIPVTIVPGNLSHEQIDALT